MFQHKNNELSQLIIQTITDGIKDGTIRKDIDAIDLGLLLSLTTRGLLENLVRLGEGLKRILNKDPKNITTLYFDLITDALKRK